MANHSGPSGLSIDLRERIIAAVERDNLTYKAAAARFSVGVATISRLKRLKRETGSVAPRPHGGGRRRVISPEQEPIVKKLVLAHPDWTEVEYQEALRSEGIEASRATVGRVIRSLGFTVKKRPSSPPSATRSTSKNDESNICPPSEDSPLHVWFSWTKRAPTSR